MVDYSKWDNIDVSDSEEEDQPMPMRPQVQRFDQASSVTFGGNGGIHIAPDAHMNTMQSRAHTHTPPAANKKAITPSPPSSSSSSSSSSSLPSPSPSSSPSSSPSPSPSALLSPFQKRLMELTLHGGTRQNKNNINSLLQTHQSSLLSSSSPPPSSILSFPNDVMWSQTRDEVTVNIIVPPHTKGKQVSVALLKQDKSKSNRANNSNDAKGRKSNDGDDEKGAHGLLKGNVRYSITVTLDGHTLLDGVLDYPIKLTDEAYNEDSDLDDDDALDWVLENLERDSLKRRDNLKHDPLERRLIRITMLKDHILKGAVVWWKRVFHGDVPIDVTKIHARKQNKKNGAGVAASSPTASDSQGASISGSANSRTNAEGLNFAEVWKEAHTQFTKNIRDGKYARTPVIIDNQDSKSE